MTSALLTDFESRRRQIRHYLAIVSSVENGVALGKPTRAQERRLVTLRAGTFLLAYNLIEATTRGALDAIHDQIITERVSFSDLTPSLRTEAVRLFKKHADEAVKYSPSDFSFEFVEVGMSAEIKLSGNVDARYLREIAQCYGFSSETDKQATWGGTDLLTIKTIRNDLAHGARTFEEVGRNYPYPELLRLTRRATFYMRDILNNVAQYLDKKLYLDASTCATIASPIA